MSTFKIISTGGHPERTEEFNGTADEFMLFKFGSRGAMEDQGCRIEEVTAAPEPAVAEEAQKPKRKKAADAE